MIRAKQVPPTRKISPMMMDAKMYDGVAVISGGYDVCDNPVYADAMEFLEEIPEDEDEAWDMIEHLEDREFTKEEAENAVDLWNEYQTAKGEIAENDCIAPLMTLLSGTTWKWRRIRGSVQGEYGTVFYDSTWLDKGLDDLEMEWFNLGDEWKITLEDGQEMSVYTHTWNEDEMKKEICDVLEVGMDEVKFSKFVEFEKTPVYREI